MDKIDRSAVIGHWIMLVEGIVIIVFAVFGIIKISNGVLDPSYYFLFIGSVGLGVYIVLSMRHLLKKYDN